MKRLQGCVALLTGGSRGIGPHIARALAREGVHVALAARDRDGLTRTAESLREHGVRALAVPADLSLRAERERLVAEAERTLGPIDILVNNAGLEAAGAFLSVDAEGIAQAVEVNLTAPLHLARLLVPGMLERGRGHVVSIASLAGKKGSAYQAVYAGTKAALIEWTHGLKSEFEGTGVGFSVVCPGFVRGTGMFARFGVEPPRFVGAVRAEQVARAVVEVIRRDRVEVIVTPLPVRPLLALYALFPGLGPPLLRWLGINEFQRRKVGAAGPRG